MNKYDKIIENKNKLIKKIIRIVRTSNMFKDCYAEVEIDPKLK